MTKQNINTSDVRAEQAASNKPQTLKLGLDVHADTIVVVRILDNSAPQPAQKFTPAKFLDWIKTQLPLAEQVRPSPGAATGFIRATEHFPTARPPHSAAVGTTALRQRRNSTSEFGFICHTVPARRRPVRCGCLTLPPERELSQLAAVASAGNG